jgi:hypothetical protein
MYEDRKSFGRTIQIDHRHASGNPRLGSHLFQAGAVSHFYRFVGDFEGSLQASGSSKATSEVREKFDSIVVRVRPAQHG